MGGMKWKPKFPKFRASKFKVKYPENIHLPQTKTKTNNAIHFYRMAIDTIPGNKKRTQAKAAVNKLIAKHTNKKNVSSEQNHANLLTKLRKMFVIETISPLQPKPEEIFNHLKGFNSSTNQIKPSFYDILKRPQPEEHNSKAKAKATTVDKIFNTAIINSTDVRTSNTAKINKPDFTMSNTSLTSRSTLSTKKQNPTYTTLADQNKQKNIELYSQPPQVTVDQPIKVINNSVTSRQRLLIEKKANIKQAYNIIQKLEEKIKKLLNKGLNTETDKKHIELLKTRLNTLKPDYQNITRQEIRGKIDNIHAEYKKNLNSLGPLRSDNAQQKKDLQTQFIINSTQAREAHSLLYNLNIVKPQKVNNIITPVKTPQNISQSTLKNNTGDPIQK